MKVAAPPQIYILQRSCHHNPEPINLNPTTTKDVLSHVSFIKNCMSPYKSGL